MSSSDCLVTAVPLRMRFRAQTRGALHEDLALDEALLQQAEADDAGPALRIWEAPELAVVLGASGRLRDDVDLEACRAEGVVIGRRSSGGGTVLIGPGALNLSVVLPASAAPGLDAVDTAQTFVLDRLAQSLNALGVEVALRGSGDLTRFDRKFAGSAQRRLRRYFLVHTSILYAFPLDAIARLTREPARQPAYRRQRSHGDFLVNLPLTRAELVGAIERAWLDATQPPAPWDVPEASIRDLVTTRFGRPDWIERL